MTTRLPSRLHGARAISASVAAFIICLSTPLFAEESAGAAEAERLLDAMVAFYAGHDAVAVDVAMELVPGAGDSLRASFRFAFRKPDRFARFASPDSAVKSTATFAAGRFVEQSLPGVYMRGCYPDFAMFLERDKFGYWMMMNQFADSDPKSAWMPPGSAVALAPDEVVDGTPCRAIRVDRPEEVVTLWIAASGDPILHRATWGKAGEAPTFIDHYAGWRFDGDVRDSDLVFEPAPGMRRVQLQGELGLVEKGTHSLLGEEDPIAGTLRQTGQLEQYVGKGRVALQPYWRFAPDMTPDQLEATIDYLGGLQALENEYRDRGISIFGALVGDEADSKRFFERIKPLGWTYEFLLDDQGYHAQQARLMAFPTLLVIGRDGRVEAVYAGISDCVHDLVREDIERLLAGERIHVSGVPPENEGALGVLSGVSE